MNLSINKHVVSMKTVMKAPGLNAMARMNGVPSMECVWTILLPAMDTLVIATVVIQRLMGHARRICTVTRVLPCAR
jgi:ABC-type glycerol-3-phosphate transport system permease component